MNDVVNEQPAAPQSCPTCADIRRKDREQYREAMYAAYDNSGTATVTLATGALRSAILVNAGTLVLLATIFGEMWGVAAQDQVHELKQIFAHAYLFLGGLVCAVFCGAGAYLLQRDTTDQFRRLAEAANALDSGMRLTFPASGLRKFLWAATMGLLFASYVFFAVGAWRVIAAFETLPSPPPEQQAPPAPAEG